MAKVIAFQIPKSQSEFIRYQEDRGSYFYDKLHQHPQVQMTLILEGKGQFLSGNYVGRFQPGDVFFLGENVPHVFRSDSEYFDSGSDLKVAGNTVFFDFQALGKALIEVEDLKSLDWFRDQSGSCFRVGGEGLNKLKGLLGGFSNMKGLERFMAGIQLLVALESAEIELTPLNQAQPQLNERDGQRMNQVMHFLLEHRFERITLEEVAAKAAMSKEAFCRFFKLRTQKTFTQYLQQLRIAEAQKLLLETDRPIAEIAFQVGYENLSYFNRVFKKGTGKVPTKFRKEALGI